MKVTNSLAPNDEQLAGFLQEPETGPIHMVNLLKFREKAQYPDGSDAELSGQEAYARYGAAVAQVITNFGGGIVF